MFSLLIVGTIKRIISVILAGVKKKKKPLRIKTKYLWKMQNKSLNLEDM